jgi:hypothetical protein
MQAFVVGSKDRIVNQFESLKKYVPFLSPAIKKHLISGKNVCAIDESVRGTRIDILATASIIGPIAAIALSLLLAAKVSAPAVIVAVVSATPGGVLLVSAFAVLSLAWFLPFYCLNTKDEALTEKAIGQEAVAQYQREDRPPEAAYLWLIKHIQAMELLFQQEKVDLGKRSNFPSYHGKGSSLLELSLSCDTIDTFALLWEKADAKQRKLAFLNCTSDMIFEKPKCITYLFNNKKIDVQTFSEQEQHRLLVCAGVGCIKYLVEYGFNLNAKNDQGQTILDRLIQSRSGEDHNESSRYNLECRIKMFQQYGATMHGLQGS